jgi:hypothetical protein
MRSSLFALGLVPLAVIALAVSVQAQPRGRIVLFEDAGFQGEQRVVDGEIRDFRAVGFNDRVSSIHIDSGTWEFCEDADFRGGCITLNRDDRDLTADGFNDRISSARPVADRGNSIGNSGGNSGRDNDQRDGSGFDQRGSGGFNRRGGNGFDQRGNGGFNQRGGNGRGVDQRGNVGVILYRDVGFGGDSRPVSDTVTDFRSLRFNDAVSSIRIASGTWEFCSDANFQGRCMTFDKDVQSLVPMNFNDTISSMRRVR